MGGHQRCPKQSRGAAWDSRGLSSGAAAWKALLLVMVVLPHHPERGRLSPHVPRGPSHDRLSGSCQHVLMPHLPRSLSTTLTPAASLWPPPSLDRKASLLGSPMPLPTPTSLKPVPSLGTLTAQCWTTCPQNTLRPQGHV